MSHDRGCFCGKERYEYADCHRADCDRGMKARGEVVNTEHVNDRQVGGSHYRSEYQHWDWVTDLQLPYVIGCATKYIIRWHRKGGAEDIQKAIHYLEKFVSSKVPYHFDNEKYLANNCELTHRFLEANMVGPEESDAIWHIMTMVSRMDTDEWQNTLKTRMVRLLQRAQMAAGGRGG